eukprot:CCRYP_000104-RA/>CCRYP_000104-RA protein AED:0.32 eAED:0.32 QI:0/0/0/1/0/0/2/0/149
MVIPKSGQHHAIAWFHHYLQHPGTKHLEEILRLLIYWKGLRTTVQSHVKKCHSCQVNKRRQLKYGKLSTKLAITNPWVALCVDLIVPAAIFGRDMLFDVPFIADWSKIGEYRQKQTDNNTSLENDSRVDWDYQPGDIVLLQKDGILHLV